jgi:alpha-galactosidase
VRVDHPDPAALVHGVVSADRGHAVFAYVQMTPSATTLPQPFLLPGLDPDRTYRVTPIHEVGSADVAGVGVPSWFEDGLVAGGRQLGATGVQPPILHPESIMLVELTDDATDPERTHRHG